MTTRLDLAGLSLMDALDLAILIEVEANQRYVMFVKQLGHRGPNDPSSVFRQMAVYEAKHGEQLQERRKAMFGDAPARVSLDDLFDVEAPDMGAPRRNMSARKAFEIALSSERKAYDFYDLALPGVTDPEVRALFEELRDEETEHVNMLETAMAELPESADAELEKDTDESPYL